MRRIINLIVLLGLVLVPLNGVAPTPVQAASVVHTDVPLAPTAPADVPVSLAPAGSAVTYTLDSSKLYWNSGVPVCPPAIKSNGIVPQATYPENISRVATYGSRIRVIYSNQVNCSSAQIVSNIVADSNYIYWLQTNGMYRISVNANPGDPSELVNALVAAPGELAMAGDRIFYLRAIGSNSAQVGYVLKSNNNLVDLAWPGNNAFNLQTDGQWVYYINGTSLYRLKPGIDVGVVIGTNVTGYFPEGSRWAGCVQFICFFTNYVFIGEGTSIYRYDNNAGTTSAALYTSGDTTASITGIVTDYTNMLFIERRNTSGCSPFQCYSFLINRASRTGASPGTIYTSPSSLSVGITHLTDDFTYLYFQGGDGSLNRLANDASTLPSINMVVTGMEVTQSIQNLSNSVPLIKNKHTYVRVYVHSTGTAVSGVGAQLEAPSLGGAPLLPVNPVGTTITVVPSPDRNDINQSFLFELPWSWTQNSSLQLLFTMNPYKVPLEPNYLDDVLSQTFTFINSPTLSVEFFRLNYQIGASTYSPRIVDDIFKTYSWILRAYPIGGAVGENFRPRIWDVAGGLLLGTLVDRINPICSQIYGNPGDDPSLCASYVANGWLYDYRQETSSGDLTIGLNPNSFYYGMISDASGFFPRGQAMYTKTSVGPAGIPGSGSWDTDGSYADWYAAHEIGHSLGRAHPNAGSDDPATQNVSENCGHSRSDPSFPYGNTSTARAPIGPADNSMEGFDTGDPAFGIKPAVLPSAIWNDVMSYCSYQWISDYTYLGMLNYMTLNPSSATPQPMFITPQAGDYLVTAGAINTATNKAGFSIVRRTTSVGSQPVISQGAYALRLLNASNVQLGTDQYLQLFEDHKPNIQDFGRVVDFIAGTRKIEIVRVADNLVLASYNISANAPTVSNVALQGAPNPVSGIVTLGWSANDADGDPLTFDVQYTRDNGTTWQPVAAGLSGTSTQLDTASLGGSGTARLRVIASDGANTGFADSASFVMAAKPPQPYILEPANNLHIHYGQLVNFSGMALDAQDGNVADAGLSWLDSHNTVLGSGPLISLDSLPVGTDVITLKATNSAGLSATTTVTVIVDDNMVLPGPTLSAGPALIGWDVPAGTTSLQSTQVSIDNTGSGSLDWTAASSASWIQLSATSGTVAAGGNPSLLTVSTDPTGLPSGTMLSGQVTISGPGGQTQTIPVDLSVGPVMLLNNYSPSFKPFFIPVVKK